MGLESVTLQLINDRMKSRETRPTMPSLADHHKMVQLSNKGTNTEVNSLFRVETGSLRPVYEFRERYREEKIFEQKEITETRPIYEQRAIFETRIEGEKDLRVSSDLSDLRIRKGQRFIIAVGDGPKAQIKFESQTKITVETEGRTKKYEFDKNDGSFRDALIGALNGIDGLTAVINADGRLSLKTVSAAPLTLEEPKKSSRSALPMLGFDPGTTNPEKVGSQRIRVGEKTAVIGTELVSTGTKSVFDGYDQVVVGFEKNDSLQELETIAQIDLIEGAEKRIRHIELLFQHFTHDTKADEPRHFSRVEMAAYQDVLEY